jgi:TonB-linked SusC/RagA family outer membrane protein
MDYSHYTTQGLNENGGEFGGVIASALQLDPTTPVEYTDPSKIPAIIQSGTITPNQNLIITAPDGKYYGISQYVAGEIRNPFVTQALNNDVSTTDKLVGNIYANITPFKGFTFTSRVGLELTFTNDHYWNPPYFYDATNQLSSGITHDNNDYYNKWVWDNFATYHFQINDNGITVLAGMSAEDYLHKNIYGTGSPMAIGTSDYAQLASSSHTADVVTGQPITLKKESYFGRLNYDYKSKYLLEASVRRDGAGSSQVPSDNAWGTFPSVSGGWVASNEDFFKSEVISYLKIRGSWGQNGSLSALGESNLYQYNPVMTGLSGGQPITYYNSTGSAIQAYEPNVLANPNLTWETSEQLDFGIDLKAFNNSLTLSADYYVKTTKGMIFPGIPSYESGNTAPEANGGQVQNKGAEFELGYKNRIGDFKYSVNLNISPLSNIVQKLDPLFGKLQPGANVGTGWNEVTVFQPGYPVWHFYGYKTNGINKANGDPIFVTKAGRDTTAAGVSDADKQDLGSAIPNFTYGGNIDLSYKNIDFALTFAGASGNKVAIGWMRTDKLAANRLTYYYDGRWTTPGVAATKPGANPDAKTYQSDQYILDASFLRIQTIQLGYSIPTSLLRKALIKSLRLSVSLDNFFVITKYPGMDPQPTIANNNPNNVGIDRGTYPQSKDVMLGASINF